METSQAIGGKETAEGGGHPAGGIMEDLASGALGVEPGEIDGTAEADAELGGQEDGLPPRQEMICADDSRGDNLSPAG